MLIGYARVSTHDQTLALQRDALEKADCEQIFTDTVSGTKAGRKGLSEALSHLRNGDTLVVWRLDRLGRSLRHLIDTVTELHNRGVGFKSLQENIDTTTSGGKLVFHIFVTCSPKTDPVTMRVQQPKMGIRRTLYGQTTLTRADRSQAAPSGGKAGRWSLDPGGGQGAQHQRGYVPPLEIPIRWDEHLGGQAAQGRALGSLTAERVTYRPVVALR
jgi:hypothetical protein